MREGECGRREDHSSRRVTMGVKNVVVEAYVSSCLYLYFWYLSSKGVVCWSYWYGEDAHCGGQADSRHAREVHV